jgi:hypothetical protein
MRPDSARYELARETRLYNRLFLRNHRICRHVVQSWLLWIEWYVQKKEKAENWIWTILHRTTPLQQGLRELYQEQPTKLSDAINLKRSKHCYSYMYQSCLAKASLPADCQPKFDYPNLLREYLSVTMELSQAPLFQFLYRTQVQQGKRSTPCSFWNDFDSFSGCFRWKTILDMQLAYALSCQQSAQNGIDATWSNLQTLPKQPVQPHHWGVQ